MTGILCCSACRSFRETFSFCRVRVSGKPPARGAEDYGRESKNVAKSVASEVGQVFCWHPLLRRRQPWKADAGNQEGRILVMPSRLGRDRHATLIPRRSFRNDRYAMIATRR